MDVLVAWLRGRGFYSVETLPTAIWIDDEELSAFQQVVRLQSRRAAFEKGFAI